MELCEDPFEEIGKIRTAGSGYTFGSPAYGLQLVVGQFRDFIHGRILSLDESRLRGEAKLLNHKTREFRFDTRLAQSEMRGDAVCDSTKKTAANGTRTGAEATGRRTTQPARHGSGADRAHKTLPAEIATCHRVEFLDGKLVGHPIIVRHWMSPLIVLMVQDIPAT
ncbi:hypothetical protein [Bradyrhizobium sp.]|uniref:hypothetical protein n=1 Tax=Bradyrhizobium sp. TaxID=376 RepID=UPI003C4DA025